MSNVAPLSFDKQQTGLIGYDISLPYAIKSRVKNKRQNIGLTELSEPLVVKHYTKLSKLNYSIDGNFYPLGSCTMKHNPRLNEKMARMDGFANIHPLQPISTLQGSLELMYKLSDFLCKITGMDDATLNPAAGAHGELAGVMVIRAAIQAKGENREYIIVPDSAHGTNPATASICGFKIISIPVTKDGHADLVELEKVVEKHGKKIAGIKLTNPSTCGLLDINTKKIADLIHTVGGYFYCDGANFNAIVGKIKPRDFGVDVMHFNLHKTFSTPHGGGGPGCGPIAVTSELAPFLPTPKVIKKQDGTFDIIKKDAKSIGNLKGFFGQFGVMVRAYSYILSLGLDGLEVASGDSVLLANYIYYSLKDDFFAPYFSNTTKYCMHECLLSDKFQKEKGVTTLDIAKALLDMGHHPMTVYFPLVVQGAMLIEPTETESLETVKSFVSSMKEIAKMANQNPEQFKSFPLKTPLRRLDEVRAAKTPVLTFDDLKNANQQ